MGISAYIARDNPTAAGQTVDTIRDAVAHLAVHPAMGRVGRINGTRELVIAGTAYIVAYRVRKGSVRILAVLHSSQRWPSKL
jgi:addiction module RelE/StbE family toxin